MIEPVDHDSVALEGEAINMVHRQSPAQPCGFERLSDAISPEAARIRVGN